VSARSVRTPARFVDWLARAGVTLWQVLPLVPPGAGHSPYSSGSAFAVQSVDDRPRHTGARPELLAPHEVTGRTRGLGPGGLGGDDRAFKGPRLALAAGRGAGRRSFAAFRAAGAVGRGRRALLRACGHRFDGAPYWEWPAGAAASRAEGAGGRPKAELSSAVVDREIALQYFCSSEQWNALRAYAADGGACGSWATCPSTSTRTRQTSGRRRRCSNSTRTVGGIDVSGVPPDAFSETGQLVGQPAVPLGPHGRGRLPLVGRPVRRVMEQTDFVRIDHFRAFAAYWAVPAGATDARMGKWRPGPGRALFDALRTALGNLPILAEDLGIIDDAVRHLLADAGLPGMKVLQFAFGERPENHYLPHNHTRDSVVYTGTHDNETTMGFWQGTSDHVRDHVRRYFGVNGHDVVWDLIRAALGSVSVFAIVPFQDLLSLGNEARMNVPAVASGNWGWRMRPEMLRDEVADRFRGLVSIYGR
jgi:4-alpha-glucanotransferase